MIYRYFDMGLSQVLDHIGLLGLESDIQRLLGEPHSPAVTGTSTESTIPVSEI